MDVLAMALIVLWIADAMIGKALLPDERMETQLLLGTEGESTFDELNGFFQRNVLRGRDDQVEVVPHDYELVQEETAFPAVVLQDIEKETRHFFFFEEGIPCVGDGRDEERADFLRGVAHVPPALKRIILNDSLTRP